MEENEMLEQTNETENVENPTTEEIEEGIELTDTTETTESDDVEDTTSNDETVEKEKEEVKTFTQDEVDEIVKRRLARKDREYQRELSKYRDTENVLRTTLKLEDGDDTNTKLREFYEAEGIKLPEPLKAGLSDDDMRALGERDAELFIKEGNESMYEEAERLAAKEYRNLNPREKATFDILAAKLTEDRERSELLKLGAKEELISSNEFKSFKNQFNSKTPIQTIYSLYTKSQPQKQVELPGSMKNSKEKPEKDFISEEEYEKMTRAEVRKNLDLIEKSMSKW